MRDATLGRVMWKEYRLQRDFWLVIAAFIVVLQLSVLVAASIEHPDRNVVPAHVYFAIGLGVPAVFALGSGAMLFAGEREAETYDFQRALPVAAGRLIAGKMLSALGGALLLLLFGALAAWLLSLTGSAPDVVPPPVLTGGLLWAGSVLTIFEVFAWSVLFSLLLHRVLWATVLGAVTAALLGFYAAQGLVEIMHATAQLDYYVESMPLRAIAALTLLAVDALLARRWFAPAPARRFPLDEVPTAVVDMRLSLGWPMRSTMFLHLVWQGWRQMWVNLVLILGSLVLVAIWMYFALVLRSNRETLSHPLVILAPCVAVLIGSTLFWADQQRAMHLYFAERGVAPRFVWFSRQCLGIGALVCWFALMSTAFAADSLAHGVLRRNDPFAVDGAALHFAELSAIYWNCLGLSILGYCTAQACSLIARSGVTGLFFGIICSWLVGMWAVTMNGLRVPLWFSVAPLPLIFLWAGWLRAPDWIDYRTTWRARGKLIASLMIPLLAIGVSVACYRVLEIPKVAVNLPLEEYRKSPTKEALETARMYEEAWKSLAALPPEVWRDSRDEGGSENTAPAAAELEAAVQQFIEASQQPECWFATRLELNTNAVVHFSPEKASSLWALTTDSSPRLAHTVLRTGNALQAADRSEEAWQRYEAVLRFAAHLRRRGDWYQQQAASEVEADAFEAIAEWAAQPSQTPERILSALRLLESKYLGSLPSPPPNLMYRYLAAQGRLDFKPGSWPDGWRIVRIAAAIMPWELARARRIVDLRVQVEQQYYADIQETLAAGKAIRHIRDREWRLKDVGLSPSAGVEPAFPERMVEAALLGGVGGEETLLFERETGCRALRLRLALLAYRAQHGKLPPSLTQLVPDELPKLPIDVYSNQPFLYRSEGVPYPVSKEPHSAVVDASSPSDDSLEPGTPFICSIGPYLTRRDGHPAGSGEPRVEELQFPHPYAAQFNVHDGTPLHNEQELWHAAWCFPVP